MGLHKDNSEEYTKVYNGVVVQERLENQATGAITSEILTKLKITVDSLPQKYQQLLHHVAKNQLALDMDNLDPMALSLRQSREQCNLMEDEYEILKLKQKNTELQAKIDRNDEFLKALRRDLACSKQSLATKDPNPDNIQDYIRQLKQKLRSYEESCEKATVKLSKLSVPEGALPVALAALAETRDAARLEAASLRARADDMALARSARDTINRLRK